MEEEGAMRFSPVSPLHGTYCTSDSWGVGGGGGGNSLVRLLYTHAHVKSNYSSHLVP